eukprot:m.90509 g.90509  ORF g.90509 m.90509 type:complete len:184 (+) comp11853_c0_seq3:151-702(+)
MYMSITLEGDRLRLTRAPQWPRGFVVPALAVVCSVYFSVREVEDQGPYTRVAAVLAVLVAGLSFIEDTQQCDVITGSKPRVEIRRRGFFDFMLGADGLKVFTGKVVSVTVTAERLRYFADGHQVTLEIDDCPIEVMVTGSVTLDPQEDHLEVARAICTHVGLDPETDISVEKLAGPVYKPHSN